MSIFTKFFKGSLLLSIASLVVRLSGVLVLIPLARILAPKQLGIYSLVFWLVQNGTILGQLGIDAAIHRNGAQLYHKDPVATGRLLGVGGTLMGMSSATLATVVWVWRLPLAEHWLGDKDAANWFSYAAIALFTEGFGLMLMTGLLSLHNFKAHALTTATGALSRLLLSPILAWRYHLIGAFFGLLLASFLQLGVAVVNLYYSIQQYRIPLSWQGFWRESKQILQFGLPYYVGNALVSLVTLPLLGELGRVAGVASLGELRIGQSASQIVKFVPMAIAPVTLSILSEAHETDRRDFQRLRSIHLRGNWLLALTLVVFLTLVARPLISWLFSDAYQPVPLAIGMSWVAFITVVVETLNLYSLSVGQTRAIALGAIVQKIAFISITFLLIPSRGSMSFVFGLLLGGGLQFFVMLAALWSGIEIVLKRQISVLFLLSVSGAVLALGLETLIIPISIKFLITVVLASLIIGLGYCFVLALHEQKRLRLFLSNLLN